MMAACLGTTREVGTGGRCSLNPNFTMWKYPMRIGNQACPQPPLKMGTYTFLREVGLIHGRGPNLKDSFGLGIHHSIEVFQDRWQDSLHEWFNKVQNTTPVVGPEKQRTFQQMYEEDVYEDDQDDDAMEGKHLVDVVGGEDRRGEVSELARSRWKGSHSSRRQRALDMSEWERALDAGEWEAMLDEAKVDNPIAESQTDTRVERVADRGEPMTEEEGGEAERHI